jgi:predicted ATPase
MIFNEPEGSLHPNLIAPLARLLSKASDRSQIIVVSHSQELVAALERNPLSTSIELRKDLGETFVSATRDVRWKWPAR